MKEIRKTAEETGENKGWIFEKDRDGIKDWWDCKDYEDCEY